MIKGKKKIVVAIFLLFLVLFPFGLKIYAQTNGFYDTSAVIEPDLDGKMKNSVLLDSVAALMYALASWVESLVGWGFELLTGANMFPWADRVIFNTIPFLDVNFLNPAPNSLFKDGNGEDTDLAKIVVSIYSTVFTLAVTFLGIVVGLMAIKLAVSSLASEKAKYKEALMKFLFSLVALFGMHYAMSFIFYINESLVEMASTILNNNTKDAKIALDINLSNKTMVTNFINQNGPVGAELGYLGVLTFVPGLHQIGILGGIVTGINSMDNDQLNSFLLDETVVEYVNEDGEKKGASNLVIAGYLLSNVNYRTFKMPDAYGNNTGNIKFSDWARWLDPTNQWEMGAKRTLAADVKIVQDRTAYEEIKKMRDDFVEKIDFDNLQLTNNNAVSNEVADALETTIYFQSIEDSKSTLDEWGDAIEQWFNDFINNKDLRNEKAYRMIMDVQKLIKGYWDPLINAHEIYVEGTRGSTTEATAETLISNMGQYFKDAAWTYETDDNGNIVGWTPSKVSLTGAMLYTIFIVQSIMFFFAYLKRFFYVVILAMLAPVIVVYDFLGKVMS